MGSRAAIVVFGLVLAVGAGVLWLPFLTKEREAISETPTPIALHEPARVVLRAGARLCLRGVTFDRDSEVVGFTLVRSPAAGAALVVSAAAPGYRARAVARPLAGQNRVPLAPPRRSAIGRLCIADAGRGAIALAGTTDPGTTSPPVTSIDGRAIGPDVAITLYRAAPSSYLDRAGDILRHASAFAWGTGFLWALAVLIVAGLPVAIAWGLALSLRT
jgi:hypothetical protein